MALATRKDCHSSCKHVANLSSWSLHDQGEVAGLSPISQGGHGGTERRLHSPSKWLSPVCVLSSFCGIYSTLSPEQARETPSWAQMHRTEEGTLPSIHSGFLSPLVDIPEPLLSAWGCTQHWVRVRGVCLCICVCLSVTIPACESLSE